MIWKFKIMARLTVHWRVLGKYVQQVASKSVPNRPKLDSYNSWEQYIHMSKRKHGLSQSIHGVMQIQSKIQIRYFFQILKKWKYRKLKYIKKMKILKSITAFLMKIRIFRCILKIYELFYENLIQHYKKLIFNIKCYILIKNC